MYAGAVVFQTPAPRGGVPLDQKDPAKAAAVQVSNPCASGRCSSGSTLRRARRLAGRFQTPAPRGGVPLQGIISIDRPTPTGFKPLRLGAVFLCPQGQPLADQNVDVSNPCASGRCSSAALEVADADVPTEFQTPAPRGGVPLAVACIATATRDWRFQTPAPRGGVPLARAVFYGTALSVFQTPAPRGGVPLVRLFFAPLAGERCFKPLRLGAVFLCIAPGSRGMYCHCVSNPCASGRCSSAKNPSRPSQGPLSFKPLRLGAVFL